MCNLGEGLYEKAYEKAYKTADRERAIAIAKKMLDRGKNTVEEIAEDTGLSVEEVEALRSLQPV